MQKSPTKGFLWNTRRLAAASKHASLLGAAPILFSFFARRMTSCCGNRCVYKYILSSGSPPSANEVLCCCGVVENGSLCTFSIKPKWLTVIFWIFGVCSSAYLRTSPPRGHSTVGVLGCCKVSWWFGCMHARSSQTTVFNSSLYIYYWCCLYITVLEVIVYRQSIAFRIIYIGGRFSEARKGWSHKQT